MKKENYCKIHKVKMRLQQDEWLSTWYAHLVNRKKDIWCYGKKI